MPSRIRSAALVACSNSIARLYTERRRYGETRTVVAASPKRPSWATTWTLGWKVPEPWSTRHPTGLERRLREEVLRLPDAREREGPHRRGAGGQAEVRGLPLELVPEGAEGELPV